MRIRTATPPQIRSSEITPERLFWRRRELLVAAAAAGAATVVGSPGLRAAEGASGTEELRPLEGFRTSPYSTDEPPSDYSDITSYNNFYEFGTGKEEPAQRAAEFDPTPWSVVVDGEVARPGSVPLERLLEPHTLEERIYRFRCVEAWSMVVPWVGVPLGDVLRRFEPSGSARFVEFETLHDPERMPGQRRATLDWPYREGLRLDEALHPLSILAVGVYGRELPNQNGAPLRLVVPWKYGFKSIKSIVRIRLRRDRPTTTWSTMAPHEYGFYANVNPKVDHPRWSQKRERRLGDFLRRDTLPFNGYGEQVAGLYAGMDLTRDF